MERLEKKIDLLITRVAKFEKKDKGSTVSVALRLLPEPLKTKLEVDALDEKLADDEEGRTAIVCRH